MANDENRTDADVTEGTPLLPREQVEPAVWGKSVLYRALFCAFMVSLSFGVTQVP